MEGSDLKHPLQGRSTAPAGPAQREPVAVIGSGLIGRAWALVFARAGHPVRLHDSDARALDHARGEIAMQLAMLDAHGLVHESADDVLARIACVESLDEAVANTVLVQENIRETEQAKRQVFARLDAAAGPETILASSTSWLPASRFTEGLAHRERCLVAHPVNPPHLVPLVELCPAPWTSPRIMDRAHALYAAAGQSPVRLAREIEGFVLNRLQGALLNEAFRLYEQGLVSAADLDTTVRDGLGRRWAFIGPFETVDLNAPGGVIDYADRYGATYGRIAGESVAFDWNAPTLDRLDQERRAVLPADQIEARSRWRDERLARLAAIRQQVGD